MGGGGGSQQTSTSTQDTSTHVTTTNEVHTGDIGLTGNDAVEFAKAIETGAAQIIQKIGDAAVPLVGGANALVQASANVAAANAASSAAASAAANEKTNAFTDTVKKNAWIIAAAIAGVALIRMVK